MCWPSHVAGGGLLYVRDSGLMKILDSGKPLRDNMANENVPAPAPTRSDDQIILFAAWVPIGKRNLSFTASASVLTIYIQQFWNTLTYEAKTRAYSFQLDETRFVLDANILREASEITPIDQARQFVSPPSGTNVDYDELMWEEFVQAIQTFLTDKANLGSPTKKGRKDKAHVIPYCRFTKLIICHLGRKHNLHQRSESLLHLAEEDLCLGNLKFIPKGEDDEVFGMPIPGELITNNIRNAPYYNAYLEMVAKHDQKIATEKGGKKKPATAKQLKPKPVKEKSSKPALAPKHKVTRVKPMKPSPAKHSKMGKVQKIRKGKSSLQLIDEDEPTKPEPEPEPEHQGEGEEYDVERAIQKSLESFQAQSQAHVGVRDSPSHVDAKTGADTNKTNSGGDTGILQIGEEQGEDVDNQVNLEEKTAKLDQGQAGSDPGKTPESRPPLEQ
ncbi:hypothetical protein Tco_0429695, partial [Tanacetum coccineum]